MTNKQRDILNWQCLNFRSIRLQGCILMLLNWVVGNRLLRYRKCMIHLENMCSSHRGKNRRSDWWCSGRIEVGKMCSISYQLEDKILTGSFGKVDHFDIVHILEGMMLQQWPRYHNIPLLQRIWVLGCQVLYDQLLYHKKDNARCCYKWDNHKGKLCMLVLVNPHRSDQDKMNSTLSQLWDNFLRCSWDKV